MNSCYIPHSSLEGRRSAGKLFANPFYSLGIIVFKIMRRNENIHMLSLGLRTLDGLRGNNLIKVSLKCLLLPVLHFEFSFKLSSLAFVAKLTM